MSNGENKQDLLVVIAAGGTVEIGMPTTAQLTEALVHSRDIAIQTAALYQREDWGDQWNGWSRAHVFEYVRDCLARFFSNPESINFELIIHTLEEVLSLDNSVRQGTADDFRIALRSFVSIPDHTAPLLNGVCFHAIDAAYDALSRVFEARLDRIDLQRDYTWFRTLWQSLAEAANVKILTINYDYLIPECIPGLGNGFIPQGANGPRFFDYGLFTDLIENGPVYIPLHGCWNFGYPRLEAVFPDNVVNRYEFQDLAFFNDYRTAFTTWRDGGRSYAHTMGGEQIRIGPIITGYRKTDKLLASPYCYYFSSVPRLINRIPRLLIIGYGCTDLHLNNWLARFARIHGSNRRVAVVTFKEEREHFSWADSVRLHAREHELVANLSGQGHAPDYIYADDFPFTSTDGNLRLWVEGFRHFAENSFADALTFLLQ